MRSGSYYYVQNERAERHMKTRMLLQLQCFSNGSSICTVQIVSVVGAFEFSAPMWEIFVLRVNRKGTIRAGITVTHSYCIKWRIMVITRISGLGSDLNKQVYQLQNQVVHKTDLLFNALIRKVKITFRGNICMSLALDLFLPTPNSSWI